LGDQAIVPRRILLTGGSGFVGGHLRAELGQAFPTAELLCPGFDVTDPVATQAAVAAADADCVVHLAAISAIPAARQDPDRAWNVNLHGTIALARAVRAQRPQAVFLFVSSADIYGASFRSGHPLDETALPAPLNVYGATKAAADLAIGQMAAEGLHALRLRAFNHTGPGQSNGFVVSAFAEQIARIAAGQQEPVLRVGALAPMRDFLDVRDVCAAYAACLRNAEALPPGTILNVASGIPRRIGEVLDQLLAIAGVSARIETESDRLRPTDIPSATGDATRLRALTGWQPCIPWEQTLADTLQYWRDRV
jgi:nucleoside-diphosphate-sugar epimerase